MVTGPTSTEPKTFPTQDFTYGVDTVKISSSKVSGVSTVELRNKAHLRTLAQNHGYTLPNLGDESLIVGDVLEIHPEKASEQGEKSNCKKPQTEYKKLLAKYNKLQAENDSLQNIINRNQVCETDATYVAQDNYDPDQKELRERLRRQKKEQERDLYRYGGAIATGGFTLIGTVLAFTIKGGKLGAILGPKGIAIGAATGFLVGLGLGFLGGDLVYDYVETSNELEELEKNNID